MRDGKGARLGFLELEGLTRTFAGQRAVDGLSLTLQRGEVLALLGPSGSGKTTTLRLLAGFEVPDAGKVILEGRDVTALAPVARRFGMVFQHYALFPHLDVGANVAFGLESRGVRGPELSRRVAESLALVDLSGFERRPVAKLSGGQQQRVALARALAPEPQVLLLDEPLSNLDPSLRERTRRELRALVHRLGMTAVVVTHEQEDAFDLGDRIALLRGGRLEQLGTSDELYAKPASAFVASFIGRASAIDARIVSADVAEVEGARWPVRWAGPEPAVPGAAARLLARPEGLRLVAPGAGRVGGMVAGRRFTGPVAYFSVLTAGGANVEVAGPPGAAHEGDVVGLEPTGADLHLYPASDA
jgi:ABC-type Fe3+/spermidine/putrescine transport system ATPase subunit